MRSPISPKSQAAKAPTRQWWKAPLPFAVTWAATAHAQASDFFWNNSAATGQWNATDANRSGSAWVHSSSNHAFFSTVGGTVRLTEPVIAGGVDFGGSSFNAASITLDGGSLDASNLTVQGSSNNPGAYSTNPSFTGPFTNNGVLDIMTWTGTLPVGFLNNGIVLDRSKVKVDSFEKTGNAFSVALKAYSGHAYQLQRSDSLTGTWQDIGDPRQGDDPIITPTDPDVAGEDRRFYRVSLRP